MKEVDIVVMEIEVFEWLLQTCVRSPQSSSIPYSCWWLFEGDSNIVDLAAVM